MDRRPGSRRSLIVPLVLAVSVAGTLAAAVTTNLGCKSDQPRRDAGTDAPTDVPLI
jgi:hypothetical protein